VVHRSSGKPLIVTPTNPGPRDGHARPAGQGEWAPRRERYAARDVGYFRSVLTYSTTRQTSSFVSCTLKLGMSPLLLPLRPFQTL